MKVIFLLANQFFTKKYYDDFYIEKISKHFETEKWCLLKLDKERYNSLKEYTFPDQLSDVVNIEDLAEFENKISNLKDKPIIVTSYFDPKNNQEIYNVIKKYNGVIIDLYKDGFTSFIRRKSVITSKNESIIRKLKNRAFLNKLIRTSYWKIINRKLIIDYCLTPLKLSYSPAKKYIPIHHVKYDTYLDVIKEAPLFKTRYVVFLDSNLPYLSDILVTDQAESVEPKKYYDLLNNFFDYIETKFNVEVIIAPHPKADYKSCTFKNRKIVKYKTANLIHNSQFVLTHDTNSNINAVLSNKPIIFLFYEEMLTKGSRTIAKATIEFAKILNSPLIDLEKNDSFEPKVDKSYYEKFKSDFIIDNFQKHKTNEDLIVEFLKTLD